MIFDTHAHYDDPAFDRDRDELLRGLKERGIGSVVDVGAEFDTLPVILSLTEQYPFVYGALGVHPSEVSGMNEKKLEWIQKTCEENRADKGGKIVAVGEIGLDYHYPDTDKKLQKIWFEAEIETARSLSMPMIIHSRDAAADTMDIMRSLHTEEIGGIVHCYSYAVEQAKTYLSMGFCFGIGGVLTYKNAKKLSEVVTFLPMEAIVLETDAPYLSPEPWRGKRNDSGNLPEVVKKISEIKGIPEEEVIRITRKNAYRVYRIPEE
ncbi:MAG: TatD family hydrolase [Lachnospiraceae bacterium]|nr:TatD family hydrolase [Lachnospiraceae bacterium]